MTNATGRRLCRHAVMLSVAVSACTGMTPAQAADYPVKPVRFIIPYPTGGAPDLMARTLGAELTKVWGQQFLVDNRPGGNGIIAAEATARAPRDGYTLFIGSVATQAINPAIYRKVPYDPEKDFAPITQIGYTPLVIVANSSVKASSVKELIALAKAEPGKLSYGTPGSGSTGHLAGELFKLNAGVNIVHVPYKGIAIATTELLGGQIALTFGNILNAMPHLKTGKLKALAVTGPTRSPALPDVPTVSESLPGYEVILWWGVFTPASVPAPILGKLETEIVRILKQPQLQQRWAADGTVIAPSNPQKLEALVKMERARWADVVKKSGARVE